MNTTEAVIISGPRKGEIVSLRDEQFAPLNGNGGEPQLSPEEDAMLGRAVEQMQRAATTATQVAQELRDFNHELRNARENA